MKETHNGPLVVLMPEAYDKNRLGTHHWPAEAETRLVRGPLQLLSYFSVTI